MCTDGTFLGEACLAARACIVRGCNSVPCHYTSAHPAGILTCVPPCATGKYKSSNSAKCVSKRTVSACKDNTWPVKRPGACIIRGCRFTAGDNNEKTKDDATCTTCPRGKRKNSATTCEEICKSCPAGERFTIGDPTYDTQVLTSCQTCPDNQFKTSEIACAMKKTATDCDASSKFVAGDAKDKTRDDTLCKGGDTTEPSSSSASGSSAGTIVPIILASIVVLFVCGSVAYCKHSKDERTSHATGAAPTFAEHPASLDMAASTGSTDSTTPAVHLVDLTDTTHYSPGESPGMGITQSVVLNDLYSGYSAAEPAPHTYDAVEPPSTAQRLVLGDDPQYSGYASAGLASHTYDVFDNSGTPQPGGVPTDAYSGYC